MDSARLGDGSPSSPGPANRSGRLPDILTCGGWVGADDVVHRCLITNCLGAMGGGEIAILRHLDHSRLPPDRLAVAGSMTVRLFRRSGSGASTASASGGLAAQVSFRGRLKRFRSPGGSSGLLRGWESRMSSAIPCRTFMRPCWRVGSLPFIFAAQPGRTNGDHA